MTLELKLPNLGENVESVDIVDVMVAPGDRITKDQVILEAETDKAVLEVPSEVAGVVVEVKAQKGQTLKVGDVILLVDESAAAEQEPAPEPAPEPEPAQPRESEAEPAQAPAADVPAPAPASESPVSAPGSAQPPVAAAPSVRRFAREIGVDIQQVPGSGAGGRVSIDDVKAFARGRGGAVASAPSVPRVTREEMTKIRKVTAEHMARCWAEIPHVTIDATADITDLEEIRLQYKASAEEVGGRLTVTAIFVKFVAEALKKHPILNASIDMQSSSIEHHHYRNLGVAVDTDRGLVVPVVRDVDEKSIFELAKELTEVSARARKGELKPDDMSGGTFTITNLGSIGVEHFTPIVNHPEVAILGMGRARPRAVLVDGEFEPRLVLPLSLSFEHRLVDGAVAARFLRSLVAAAENPLTLFFETS
jgi:pyruvate dehydrogenase E2 component (dihydrolipoamide acetyltransferase)